MKRKICFKILLLLILTLFTGCSGDEEVSFSVAEDENASGTEVSEEVSAEEEVLGSEAETKTIFVYVIGAVNKPGVYEVEEGTRVFAVIESAGGLREDAVPEALNMASVLQDGVVIKVPDRVEYKENKSGTGSVPAAVAGTGGSGKGLININTADIKELTEINGIGESRAQAIISYREENGSFKSIEDIMKVTGIKDGLFKKIKDQITV